MEDRIRQIVVDHRLQHGLCHQCGSCIFSRNEDGAYVVPQTIPNIVENGRCVFCYPNPTAVANTNSTTQSPSSLPFVTSLASHARNSPNPLEINHTTSVAIKLESDIATDSTETNESPPEMSQNRKRKTPEDADEEAKKPPAKITKETITVTDADDLQFTGTVTEGTAQQGTGTFTHIHTKGEHKGKSIVYKGGFMNGKFHGEGISQDFATGCTFEGTFDCGAAHGFGTCKWAQGWEYEGEWFVDKRHGRGICRQLADGGESYEGEWKNDQWDGEGCLKFAGGGQYDGDFKHDKLHGKGKYQFADGSLYEGFFQGRPQRRSW